MTNGLRRKPANPCVVRGINLVTLAWSDGDSIDPTDYRLVDPADAVSAADERPDFLPDRFGVGFESGE